MFLPVKRAPCAAVLSRLMDAIQAILEDSVRTLFRTPDFPALADEVGPEFGPLLSSGKVRSAIEGIFRLLYPQRLEICNAFKNDAAFDRHINDEAYHLSGLSQDSAKALRALLDPLYTAVRKGFPPGGAPQFSGQLLRQQYAAANDRLGRVCPVCVGEILFTQGEGENDHYFPRSKFPTLTLHPCNLLPICPNCNGPSFKHEKNPVAAADAGPGELQTVFLPYLRPARPEVTLGVGVDGRVVMTPSPGAGQYTAQRIKNLDRLYRLTDRWSEILSNVCDDIEAEWQTICERHETSAERLASLRQLLRRHVGSTRDRREFIKGVYCEWLLTKNDAVLVRWVSSYRRLRVE